MVYYCGVGSSLVSELVAAGLVGYYLGTELDKKWDHKPWATTICILFFVIASLVHVIWMLQKLQDRINRDEDDSSTQGENPS